ncbi:MAG: hypothetical protein IJC00_03150, partial [Clostridia bacterium]|nr:hypothetical protein [Clostridia bacterium]
LKFPLAEVDKETVRFLASDLIPDLAEKPDSMEICFIPDDDRLGFLAREAGADTLESLRGDFIDASGNVLGQHDGIHCYTIGQRRGLTLAFGERAYVAAIDPVKKPWCTARTWAGTGSLYVKTDTFDLPPPGDFFAVYHNLSPL